MLFPSHRFIAEVTLFINGAVASTEQKVLSRIFTCD